MLARGLVGRIVRVAGWGLIILGMVAVSVIVTRGAFRAHSDAQFNRWTGWATILALSVAGVGVALVAWDRIVKIIWPDKESGQEPLTAEDKLSATRNAECELPGRPLLRKPTHSPSKSIAQWKPTGVRARTCHSSRPTCGAHTTRN